MKLKPDSDDALCPVCALGGVINPLSMVVDSLTMCCDKGHTFDTIELSRIASRNEHKS